MSSKQFSMTPLDARFRDGTTWELLDSFTIHLGHDHYNVPKGFVTDFASTPRFVWRIFPRVGRYGPASVIHDWLYSNGFDRKAADLVFYEIMSASGIHRWQAWMMWVAVRWFGWLKWTEGTE